MIQYRVSYLFVDLGVFDLGVSPSYPAAQPLLPNSHLFKQNGADSGSLKIQDNPTQSTSRWDTLYERSKLVRKQKSRDGVRKMRRN